MPTKGRRPGDPLRAEVRLRCDFADAIAPFAPCSAPTPREIIDELPASVRVGGFDFRIEKWNPNQTLGAQRWGEFSSAEARIAVQRDMPTVHKAVDTVLHEISHAIFWVYGIEDEDKEERIVSTFGSAWMALYRDNPWLLDWIKRALAA